MIRRPPIVCSYAIALAAFASFCISCTAGEARPDIPAVETALRADGRQQQRVSPDRGLRLLDSDIRFVGNASCQKRFVVEAEGFYAPIRIEASARKCDASDLRKEAEELLSMPKAQGVRMVVANRVMVTLKAENSRRDLENFCQTKQCVIERALDKHTYAVRLAEIGIQPLDDHMRLMRMTSFVASVARDPIVRVTDTTPNDPNIASQWALGAIGAGMAWDRTQGTDRFAVTVIDTGVDRNHPDLSPNMWQNPGEIGVDSHGNDKRTNGVDDDLNGYTDDVFGYDFYSNDNDPIDDNQHGTYCAGILGAKGNNSIGVAGVAWRASIMGLKFLSWRGLGAMSDAARAMDYARIAGAKIFSNSWGQLLLLSSPDGVVIRDAIARAEAAGCLVVIAAGNDAIDIDEPAGSHNPASFKLSNTLSVAASTQGNAVAAYSNVGVNVDLIAPGSGIYSPLLNSGYRFTSGTSMAAPMVAAGALLIWDLHPSWTYAQVRARLMGSVDRRPSFANVVSAGGQLHVGRAIALDDLIAPLAVRWVETGVPNGLLQPGEAVQLKLSLFVSDHRQRQNIQATLSTSDGATITTPTQMFSEVPPDGEASPTKQFDLVFDANLTTPKKVFFNLAVTEGTQTWNHQIATVLLKPEDVSKKPLITLFQNPQTPYLEYYANDFRSARFDRNDHGINPGGRASVMASISNEGDADAHNVAVQVEIDSNAPADFVPAVFKIGTLPAFGTARVGPINFQVHSDATPPAYVGFTLTPSFLENNGAAAFHFAQLIEAETPEIAQLQLRFALFDPLKNLNIVWEGKAFSQCLTLQTEDGQVVLQHPLLCAAQWNTDHASINILEQTGYRYVPPDTRVLLRSDDGRITSNAIMVSGQGDPDRVHALRGLDADDDGYPSARLWTTADPLRPTHDHVVLNLQPITNTQDDARLDCFDFDPEVHPEICNGKSDDCDDTIDEGFACVMATTQPCLTACGVSGTQTCASDCSGFGACRTEAPIDSETGCFSIKTPEAEPPQPQSTGLGGGGCRMGPQPTKTFPSHVLLLLYGMILSGRVRRRHALAATSCDNDL